MPALLMFLYGLASYAFFLGTFLYAIAFIGNFPVPRTIDAGPAVPATEALGRKDVWRLHRDGSVTVFLQFREFTGMFVEHCHNTTHEDNSMLLRWDLNGELRPLPSPIPRPQGVTFEDPD